MWDRRSRITQALHAGYKGAAGGSSQSAGLKSDSTPDQVRGKLFC
jgi:hypothetical protein